MLGDRIKELRNKKGILQQELADALTVSKSTVGMWETNKREPDLETVKEIAIYFHVSVDYLIDWEQEKWQKVWDKEAKAFENKVNEDFEMLTTYLRETSDNEEEVRVKYDLIIQLSRLNTNGIKKMLERLDELSRLEEYKSEVILELENLTQFDEDT